MTMVSWYLYKNKQGFTLLEIIIAMGLVAFCLMGMAALLIALGNIEAENRKKTKALFCAQETLETLRFKIEASVVPVESTGHDVILSGPYQGMEKQWSLNAYDPESELIEVSVQCAYWWKGERKVTGLQTLVGLGP